LFNQRRRIAVAIIMTLYTRVVTMQQTSCA